MKTTPTCLAAVLCGCLLATSLSPSAEASRGRLPVTAVVHAATETPALYDDEEGGNASGDDPAIWVDPTDSANSLVIVTAKEGGLRVYDMAAAERQALPASEFPAPGRYNNVDIAYDLAIRGRRTDVAVVSDRYNDTLRFYAIDPRGARATNPLTEITAPGYSWLFTDSADELADEHTAYGLTVWQPRRGQNYAVVTREGSTELALARLVVDRAGRIGYRVVRTWSMPSTFRLPDGSSWSPCDEPGVPPQLEGLVVDQASGVLYAAQEDVGLWRMDLKRPWLRPRLVDRVTTYGRQGTWNPDTEECVLAPDRGFGGHITPDAEGLDILYGRGRSGQLVLSAQGSDEFLLYERQGRNRYLGSFRVEGTDGVDDVNGSDGLAVTNRRVGQFRQGLLVTHDEPEAGAEVDADRDATNFSYVSWGDVATAFGLRVDTRAGNDPRMR